MFRYLVRRVGADEADPLLGEVFRVAFERRSRYDCGWRDARPWLYGIAIIDILSNPSDLGSSAVAANPNCSMLFVYGDARRQWCTPNICSDFHLRKRATNSSAPRAEIAGLELPGEPDHREHLAQVLGAVRAAFQMRLEAPAPA